MKNLASEWRARSAERINPLLAKQLVFTVALYLAAVGGLLLSKELALRSMGRIRADIGAEVHIAEALARYAGTRDGERLAAYRQALAQRVATGPARAALDRPEPDFTLAHRWLREDRAGDMVIGVLNAATRRLPLAEKPERTVEAQEAADAAIARLERLALAVHGDASASRVDAHRGERMGSELQRAAAALREAEREYTLGLEDVTRALGRVVERGVLVLSLGGFVLLVAVSLVRLSGLRRALTSLRARLIEVAEGKTDGPLDLDAPEEIGALAPAFEQMRTKLRESKTRAEGNSRELAKTVRELENIMETIPDIICILDLLGRLDLWNRNLETATGLSNGELSKRPLSGLFVDADKGGIDAAVREAVERGRFEAEGRLLRADGSAGSYHWTGATLEDERGCLLGLTVSGRDITERKTLEEQLARQAFHDPLTGLPNRTLFMDRVAHALSRVERRKAHVAVLFLDLDRFKIINDSLGHGIGDRLLVEVGQRLLRCLRPQDTIARLGGDEFGILLEDVLEARDATVVAERIASELGHPFLLDGREVHVTTSVGIALNLSREARPEELVRDADLAMYNAKSKGKARYEVFDGSGGGPALERLDLELDLRSAIGREEFRVHFQPIVTLGTGRVMEVEALVRWDHRQRGLLSPAEFIGLSEETGLIVPIGRWVLAQACRQARAWQAEYPNEPPLVVSVNLSARQFQQPDLVPEIAEILGSSGLHPACLKLEITESVVMHDAPSTLAKLQDLKRLGIQLAIDDFGTGYSSLGYLKRFPVDTLKIDRSFIKGIGQDVEDMAIVRAVLTVAKSLNLSVTAEGIETAEQLAQLKVLGCDRGQGYYFARPLAAIPMRAVFSEWRLPRNGDRPGVEHIDLVPVAIRLVVG